MWGAWLRRNARQRCEGGASRRGMPAAAHRAHTDVFAERPEFADDARRTPARVLPGELPDQSMELRADPWASGAPPAATPGPVAPRTGRLPLVHRQLLPQREVLPEQVASRYAGPAEPADHEVEIEQPDRASRSRTVADRPCSRHGRSSGPPPRRSRAPRLVLRSEAVPTAFDRPMPGEGDDDGRPSRKRDGISSRVRRRRELSVRHVLSSPPTRVCCPFSDRPHLGEASWSGRPGSNPLSGRKGPLLGK